MVDVNLKQAKLFVQAIAYNKFPYMTLKEHEVMDKTLGLVESSELFASVGEMIEAYAKEVVETYCKPERDKIVPTMNAKYDEQAKLVESTKDMEENSAAAK